VIVYRLTCSSGHEFEGWFRDSKAYDAQAARGALECPTCCDKKISKAIMAPAVTSCREQSTVPPGPNTAPDSHKMRQFMAGYRKFIEENAEYVGPKFPEEARKIHYGDTEERHIYGESSLKEARDLIEEGIEIAPVPPDPGDLN
jgi:hypothetical protein